MNKYNTKNNKKYLGLLNFEGDVFRAYKENEDKFVIIDDNHEFILTTDKNGVRDVLSGKIILTTSSGRTYKISEEHQNARPRQEAIDNFLGTESGDEYKLWFDLKNKIDKKGFEKCFLIYSDWDEIKDKEFHSLKRHFIKSMGTLMGYVNTKVSEGKK